MPILIDRDLCDVSIDCAAARWCPTGALTVDRDRPDILYRQDLCQSCGTCVNWCGPAAIYLARDEEELQLLRNELENVKKGGVDSANS